MSSNTDYWVQREQDWLEECEKEEKSWNKAIDKIYTDLSAEIQEEVERFILRFGSAEGMDMATARRYLSATDIQYYASLAEKYCKQAHRDMADGTYSRDSSKEYFTEQANAEMRRYNAAMKISRLQMLQSQLALKTFNAQAKTNAVMETATIKRAESEFRRQAGILGETVLNNLDMAETLAKASFHGATFSERIWGPHQEKLQTKLNKAIRNMLILGKGAGPFTRELSRDLGVTKREAQRLLTTELARVQVQAQMESMIEAGFDQYTFITNPNCCNECRALNGKHFSLQKDKRAGRIPPIHPNCRCTTAAYVDEDTDDDFDEVAFDKWSESYDEHGLSWEEWKQKNQDSETQIDFMGRAFSKKVSFGKGSYKFHQVDESGLFYTQTHSKYAQKAIEETKQVLSGFGKGLKLNGVYIMNDRDIPGLAAYDHVEDVLYLNQKLFEDGFIEAYQKTPGYFAARDGKEALIHELSHKKHWDKIKLVQESDPVKYANIEVAKERVEYELRKYVRNQSAADPLYVSRIVSGNAEAKFDNRRELNELIADASVLEETGRLSDRILAQLIEGILK